MSKEEDDRMNGWLIQILEKLVALEKEMVPWKEVLDILNAVFPEDNNRRLMYGEYLDSRGFVVRAHSFSASDMNYPFMEIMKPDDTIKIKKERIERELEDLRIQLSAPVQ